MQKNNEKKYLSQQFFQYTLLVNPLARVKIKLISIIIV